MNRLLALPFSSKSGDSGNSLHCIDSHVLIPNAVVGLSQEIVCFRPRINIVTAGLLGLSWHGAKLRSHCLKEGANVIVVGYCGLNDGFSGQVTGFQQATGK
jgi:hypothetical protein